MARFRNRETGENVAAIRLSSPKQVETRDRGWITAGCGTWEVVSLTPGIRPLVLEDPGFRAEYEGTDADAGVALAAPGPGDLDQQLVHEAPAPPAHTAAQSLPETPTARDYAREHQVATPVEDEEANEENPTPESSSPTSDDGDDVGAGQGPEGEEGDLSIDDDGAGLGDLSNDSLRELCEQEGLSKSGNKAEMVDRLEAHYAATGDDGDDE